MRRRGPSLALALLALTVLASLATAQAPTQARAAAAGQAPSRAAPRVQAQAPARGRASVQLPVQVQAKGCDELDEVEVARILAIELSLSGEEVAEVHAPVVEAQCSPSWVRLTLYDRETGGYLDRVIPAPDPADPGRERVVALAASQLVSAWLPRATAPVVVAEEPLPAAPPPAEEPAPGASELSLSGGARARDLAGRPAPLVAVGLGMGFGVAPGWSVGPAIELAHGQVERRAGQVDVDTVALGLGVGWELGRWGALRLDAAGVLFGAYAKLEGEPAGGFQEARPSTDTVALDLELSLGPAWSHGPLSIGVMLRAGAAVAEREARVQQDDPVRLGGPWLGADVVFRFRLSERPEPPATSTAERRRCRVAGRSVRCG